MQVHSHHAHTAPTKPWWVKRCCASHMNGLFQNTRSSIFTKDASFMDSLHVFNITAPWVPTHLQCGGRLLRGEEACLRQGWLLLLVKG